MSKALEVRDKMTTEKSFKDNNSLIQELAKIDNEYNIAPSQKLLDDRLKLILEMMRRR